MLVTVSKLKPKSTPTALPIASLTRAKACAVPFPPEVNTPVDALKTAPLDAAGASVCAGSVPPTMSVRSTTVFPLASVTKVSTPCTSVVPPALDDKTDALTTRTAHNEQFGLANEYAPRSSVDVVSVQLATPSFTSNSSTRTFGRPVAPAAVEVS